MERFEVKHYTEDPHPTIKGNGFDGLVVGNYREEAERFVNWVNAALSQGAQKPTTNKPSAKCHCGAEAVYHYCRICWCMEIDSQKQADTSHVG